MPWNRSIGGWLTLALSATIATAAATRIHLPGGGQPAVLERLGPLDGLTAIALGPGEERAAVAFPGERPGHSTLRLYSPAEGQRTMPLSGVVRDLLYDRSPGTLYVLLHRPAKRSEGETTLTVIDLATLKIANTMRVPPSSSALDHWIAKGSLLVAARDEIRTIQAPALRSGPLYRVPGHNTAVASVGGGGLILVGQTEGLLLVNLDDPPDEHQMPIRERIDASLPVRSLAAAPDGSGALARLDDGSLWSIAFQPLRWQEQGTTSAVTAPRPTAPATAAIRQPESATRPPAAEPAPPAPASPSAQATPSPRPRPTPPAAPEKTAATETASSAATVPAEPDAPEPVPPAPRPADEESPVPTPTRSAPTETPVPGAPETAPPVELPQVPAAARTPTAPEEAAPAATTTGATSPAPAIPTRTLQAGPGIHGRLVGPAANDTLVVVVRGPDNILREAARLKPENGVWVADGLAPGRYRIQVESGSDRVLTVDPPLLVIDVPDGDSVPAPDFRVLR